jgi:hypothetical protein
MVLEHCGSVIDILFLDGATFNTPWGTCGDADCMQFYSAGDDASRGRELCLMSAPRDMSHIRFGTRGFKMLPGARRCGYLLLGVLLITVQDVMDNFFN